MGFVLENITRLVSVDLIMKRIKHKHKKSIKCRTRYNHCNHLNVAGNNSKHEFPNSLKYHEFSPMPLDPGHKAKHTEKSLGYCPETIFFTV